MRDSERSHVHLRVPRAAVFYEDWMKLKLEHDDILVPPEHQPLNPDDDDDFVPDQQAAFGIVRSQQKSVQPSWKDLGLKELLERGPDGGDETLTPSVMFSNTDKITDENIVSQDNDESGSEKKQKREFRPPR
jgi:hypothetical protein